MPRLLKLILPYAFAVVGAIAIFFAGAYSSSYFTGRILTPRLGLQDVAELATDQALLTSLDANKVESARALLIMQEDGHLVTVDMMASYYPDDLAKSACRMRPGITPMNRRRLSRFRWSSWRFARSWWGLTSN